MTETKRKQVDWDLIEPDWRANVKSKQQLSQEYGVSRAAMDKHFGKLGIVRDLGEKIRAKADALVTQAVVTRPVTAQTTVTEQEIIEGNAVLQATIIQSQRKDISRSRRLTMSLLDELEHQTEHTELYRQLGELLAAPDERGQDKRLDLFMKAMSLPSRTTTMKQLADSLKVLIALEREAFGIDARQEEGNAGIDDVIRRVRDRVG